MSYWSVQFEGELRITPDELGPGETPVDAAYRVLGPVGVLIGFVEDAELVEPVEYPNPLHTAQPPTALDAGRPPTGRIDQ